jgi:hypothetical protein
MGLSLQEWSVSKEREYLMTVLNPGAPLSEQDGVIYYPTFCDWWRNNIPFKDEHMGMLGTYKLALHHYQKDVHENKGLILQVVFKASSP